MKKFGIPNVAKVKIGLSSDTEVKDIPDRTYVQLLYLTLLGRWGDSFGLDYWENQVKKNGRVSVLQSFLGSPEFVEYLRQRKPLIEILHEVRCEWVKLLPEAKKILDIGGASSVDKRGALLMMGFPHKPEKIVIIDKKPAEQLFTPSVDQENSKLPWGGEVEYYYQDLETLENEISEKFDMIFMGQTVEHMPKDVFVGKILPFIKKRLSENGCFVFDTPNRKITSIQSPDKFINPDHDYEYNPTEMKELLEKAGFEIKQEWGMMPLPAVLKSQKWNEEEARKSVKVVSNLDISYFFAFSCSLKK